MITLIAAMDRNRVIGVGNGLPWHIPEDLKNFRKLTSGSTVVMGRKTYDSIGKPLPDRNNIVITRSDVKIKGADVCNSIDSAIEKAKSYGKEIFIIGGGAVFEQTIGIADRMALSFVKKEVQGDAFFPVFNEDEWEIESRDDFTDFELVIYRKR